MLDSIYDENNNLIVTIACDPWQQKEFPITDNLYLILFTPKEWESYVTFIKRTISQRQKNIETYYKKNNIPLSDSQFYDIKTGKLKEFELLQKFLID